MNGLSRRCFLFAAGALAGGGAGAVARGADVATPELLRPPGARDEADFLAACIRCGQCVSACPHDTLRLAELGDGLFAHGTPYLVASEVPCYLCRDSDALLCIEACPSGALQEVGDVAEIDMGTAVIREDLCFAYNFVTCRACWHACPFPGEALAFDDLLRPVIDEDRCIGCGLCEHACLTEVKSVTIRPRGAGGAA